MTTDALYSIIPVVQQQVLKSKAMQVVEHRLGETLESYFQRRYVEDGVTLAVIADELGIQVSTTSRWMAQLGMGARLIGQRAKPAEAIA